MRAASEKKADLGLREKFSTYELKQKKRRTGFKQKISFRNKEADSKVRGTAKVLQRREDVDFSSVDDSKLQKPNSKLATW